MNIKELRIKHGYSQEQLASLTNLSTRTIQRIEKENSGSKESLNAIAKVFNFSYEELINYMEQEEIIQKPQDNKLKIFILVNILLFIINITATPEHLWFIYPLLGWGIPLFYKRYKSNNNL
jgi:transcriptional regulator with XRE-family HTH domain